MKKVLIIFGGCSTEYEVSLQSVTAVLEAIDRERYEVLLLGITREGKTYLYEGDEKNIAENTWQQAECYPATISMSRECPTLWVDKSGELVKKEFDIAFPVLHGKNGEDGTIQGVFEMAHSGSGFERPIVGVTMPWWSESAEATSSSAPVAPSI